MTRSSTKSNASPRLRAAIVGLGANLDRRALRFLAAWRLLSLLLGGARRSGIYETPPSGFVDQPPFWNAAVCGSTDLPAVGLVDRLKEIESALGRVRRFRNGPREIDLDLLVLGDERSERSDVIVPHPRLLERSFALVPAAEVAPHLLHPGAQRSLGVLAARWSRPLPLVAPADAWERLAGVPLR